MYGLQVELSHSPLCWELSTLYSHAKLVLLQELTNLAATTQCHDQHWLITMTTHLVDDEHYLNVYLYVITAIIMRDGDYFMSRWTKHF